MKQPAGQLRKAVPLVVHCKSAFPQAGVLYSFEKLYANQSADGAYFEIPYASGPGNVVIYIAVLIGTALIWAALLIAFKEGRNCDLRTTAALFAAGVLILWLFIAHYGAGQGPAVVLSLLLLAAAAAAQYSKLRVRKSAARDTADLETNSAEI